MSAAPVSARLGKIHGQTARPRNASPEALPASYLISANLAVFASVLRSTILPAERREVSARIAGAFPGVFAPEELARLAGAALRYRALARCDERRGSFDGYAISIPPRPPLPEVLPPAIAVCGLTPHAFATGCIARKVLGEMPVILLEVSIPDLLQDESLQALLKQALEQDGEVDKARAILPFQVIRTGIAGFRVACGLPLLAGSAIPFGEVRRFLRDAVVENPAQFEWLHRESRIKRLDR